MAFQGLPQSSNEGDVDGTIMAEINITPLVDVFLVLLVIFMVTASALSQTGVDVNLPVSSSELSESNSGGVIVSLLGNGRVEVNGNAISGKNLAQLEGKVRAAIAQDPASKGLVILEGDRSALLGRAIEVMDAARRGGAKKFAIATQAGD